MSAVEAVTVVRMLPTKLRHQESFVQIPQGFFVSSQQKIMMMLSDASEELHIDLTYRYSDQDKEEPTGDLVVYLTDSIQHPHCLGEIAKVILEGRAHMVQVVSALPAPDADWIERLSETEVVFLNARQTEGGVLLPASSDQQPELLDRLRIQELQKFGEQDARDILHKASSLREIYGRAL